MEGKIYGIKNLVASVANLGNLDANIITWYICHTNLIELLDVLIIL